ncbi:hypothetical protein V6N11_006888 [Hibiscus sabdariffa]|uniref:Uncharacterized protein n=1 Tax=Hibiscus sabdariffa TaxID=183260 RepID=A0ABR2RSE4_9ROSI
MVFSSDGRRTVLSSIGEVLRRNEGGSNKNAGKFLPSSSASHGHDSVKMIIGSEKEDDTVQWKDSGKAHKPRPAMYNLHDGSRCPAEIPKKEGKNLDAVLKAETRGILSISYHMSQYVSSLETNTFRLKKTCQLSIRQKVIVNMFPTN